MTSLTLSLYQLITESHREWKNDLLGFTSQDVILKASIPAQHVQEKYWFWELTPLKVGHEGFLQTFNTCLWCIYNKVNSTSQKTTLFELVPRKTLEVGFACLQKKSHM